MPAAAARTPAPTTLAQKLVARAAGRDPGAISAAAPQAECCGEPLRRLEHMLHTQVAPDDVAAMVIEPVIGEGGYIVPPQSFLQGLRRICLLFH